MIISREDVRSCASFVYEFIWLLVLDICRFYADIKFVSNLPRKRDKKNTVNKVTDTFDCLFSPKYHENIIMVNLFVHNNCVLKIYSSQTDQVVFFVHFCIVYYKIQYNLTITINLLVCVS